MIEQATRQGPSVLVIAADELMAGRCRKLLESAGCRVTIATTWRAGVEAAIAEHVQLAIIDADLAEVDGLSVLALLRADPATASLPILLTARVDDPVISSRARRLGALEVVLKGDLTASRLRFLIPKGQPNR